MLPVVADSRRVMREIVLYTIAMVICSLVFGPFAHLNLGYEVPAAVLGVLFLWKAAQLARMPNSKVAMRLFGYSISYLTLLFVAMGVDAIVQHP